MKNQNLTIPKNLPAEVLEVLETYNLSYNNLEPVIFNAIQQQLKVYDDGLLSILLDYILADMPFTNE